MALENLVGADKFIGALVPSNPTGGDDKREGDDHIRGIKNALKNSFPNVNGAVTATEAQLNMSADVQNKVARTGDTMSGPLTIAIHAEGIPATNHLITTEGNPAYGAKWGYGLINGVWAAMVQAVENNAPSSILLNPNGGKVGVNTPSPIYTFEVQGNIASLVGAGQTPAIIIGQAGVSSWYIRTPGSGYHLEFFDAGVNAARAQISGQGAFGLGTNVALAYDVVGCANLVGGGYQIAMRQEARAVGDGWYFGQHSNGNLELVNVSNVGVFLPFGGQAWVGLSDERIKTGFVEFTDAAAKVGTLRAGTGRFVSDAPSVSRAFLIAQEVRAVLPEAVSEAAPALSKTAPFDAVPTQYEGGPLLGVAYGDVVPLLVAAIKELTARVAALEAV